MNDLEVTVVMVLASTLLLLTSVILSHFLLAKKFLEKKANANTAADSPKTDGSTAPCDVIPAEIIAAISAAIAAYTGLPEDGFVVRSVRRVKPWNDAAKREQQRRIY